MEKSNSSYQLEHVDWFGELIVYFSKVSKLMLDPPSGCPFIQKWILKNRYKFDHVARHLTV